MSEQPKVIQKDPDARRDYGWDWGQWLTGGETLTAVTATGVNVTVEPPAIIGSQTVAFATGGTPGAASIRFHITTSAGRQDDRTIRLWVLNR